MSIKSFVFDKYGYYPSEIVDYTFVIEQWIFHLEFYEEDEEKIKEINEFSLELNKIFNGRGVQLIKNRSGNFISYGLEKPVVLLCAPLGKMDLNEVRLLHDTYLNYEKDESFTISNLIKIWEDKVELIESQCSKALKKDEVHYNDIFTAMSCALGMAENAIQYLAEAKLDYGDEITNLTLVHKRLNSLDSWTFFNPFNLILSHRVRDYAELYKFELINMENLIDVLSRINLNAKEASLLMARLLFPTRIFDLLEENYLKNGNITSRAIEYCNCASREITRLKNIHRFLVNFYHIRPIKWLQE